MKIYCIKLDKVEQIHMKVQMQKFLTLILIFLFVVKDQHGFYWKKEYFFNQKNRLKKILVGQEDTKQILTYR